MIRKLAKLILHRFVPACYRDLDAQRLAVDEAVAEHTWDPVAWGHGPYPLAPPNER